MGISWRLVYALSTLVCACGGGAALGVRRDDGCNLQQAPEGHDLQAYLEVESDAGRGPLCPGHDLTDAEALRVTLELAKPSFVRMIFVTPDGHTGELVRADARVPTREVKFDAPRGLLTHSEGEAQLVIVASLQPLENADPAMAAVLDVIHETGVLVDESGHLTQPTRTTDAHPEQQFLGLASGALHADFDTHGVAMLTLALHTRP